MQKFGRGDIVNCAHCQHQLATRLIIHSVMSSSSSPWPNFISAQFRRQRSWTVPFSFPLFGIDRVYLLLKFYAPPYYHPFQRNFLLSLPMPQTFAMSFGELWAKFQLPTDGIPNLQTFLGSQYFSLGKKNKFNSWLCPMSSQLHDIKYTKYQLSNLFLFPTLNAMTDSDLEPWKSWVGPPLTLHIWRSAHEACSSSSPRHQPPCSPVSPVD